MTLQQADLDARENQVEARRWGGSLAVIVALHAVPVLIAAFWLGPTLLSPPAEPAVLVDMAPPATPPAPPSARPVGPPQVEAVRPRPQPRQDPVQTPEIPSAAAVLPAQPPQPHQVAETPSPATTAPPSVAAPPAPRASSGAPTWEGLVLGRLNQFKRYPREAQARRQQGAPYVRFVMDRSGLVLSSRLERSSGVRELDREAVALPRRAQPLPKPPADVPGDTVELVVPVEFFVRR